MPSKSHFQTINSQVALLLRSERERQNLSMTVVAAKAGLSQQMISYVEREMRNPTLDTFLRITQVLGVDASDVLRSAMQRAGARKNLRPNENAGSLPALKVAEDRKPSRSR